MKWEKAIKLLSNIKKCNPFFDGNFYPLIVSLNTVVYTKLRAG